MHKKTKQIQCLVICIHCQKKIDRPTPISLYLSAFVCVCVCVCVQDNSNVADGSGMAQCRNKVQGGNYIELNY